jgi:alanyl-tRNA synthetase
VKCMVDYERRGLLANNHTGTHILNLGLRKVLGGEIDQKGSEVAPEKFRFDYNAKAPMKPEQAKAVEQLVRDQISEARAVFTKVVPLADAKRVKALRAVFGETYPDPVRVVVVGAPVDEVIADPENEKWFDYSVELCGGTHLRNSADAKGFVLVEDSAVGGGLRRIVGLTGDDAIEASELGASLHSQVRVDL